MGDNNDDHAVLVNKAKVCADAGKWEDAAEILGRLVANEHADTALLDKYGWYLSRAKRHKDAMDVYLALTQKEPGKAKWFYMLGYQYYDQKFWQEALIWFDKALVLNSTYLVVLYRKGYAHTQLHQIDLAEEAFAKVIAGWLALAQQEREPEAKYYADACFQLGKLWLKKGLTRKAEKVLSEAVKYGPPDVFKYYEYGKALLNNGCLPEALAALMQADRLESGKDFVLVHMARAHLKLQQLAEADAALARVPTRGRKAYVWHCLGELRLAQGNAAAAVECVLLAIKLDPKNHNSQYLLGQAYEQCGDVAKACQAYSRAVALRRQHYQLDFPDAQKRLATLEAEANAEGEILDVSPLLQSPDGYIKMYRPERGFGFIEGTDGTSVFFHVSDVINSGSIAIGMGARYTIDQTPKGPRATQVSIL